MESMEDRLRQVEEAYYHGEKNLISDEEYDALVIAYEKQAGKPWIKKVPPPPNSIEMPIYLSGLKKIYTDGELGNFLKNREKDYILSEKVNGHAALYFVQGGQAYLLNSNDNKKGRSLKGLLPFLSLPILEEGYAVRGELVIPTSEYHSDFGFKEPRSMLSSIVASKEPKKEYATKVQLITYNLYWKGEMTLTPEEQMLSLEKFGFKTARWIKKDIFDLKWITDYLEEAKEKALYSIDGIVIAHNRIYPLPKERDPDYMVAFKKREEGELAKVISVSWKVGKSGNLMPTVHIEPIELSSIKIKKLSGKSLQFIMKGIGPGAIIRVARSGDSIPDIQAIITPTEPQLPPNDGSWKFNSESNPTYIKIIDTNHDEIKRGIIASFLKALSIKGLGEKGIEKLVAQGIRGPLDLIALSLESFVLALGGKKGETVYNAIQTRIKEIFTQDPFSSPELMAASGLFPGIAEKNAALFLKKFPNFHSDPPDWNAKNLGEKFNIIISHLEEYKNFIEAIRKLITDRPQEVPSLLTLGEPVISKNLLKELRSRIYLIPSHSSISLAFKEKLSFLIGKEHVKSSFPKVIEDGKAYTLVIPPDYKNNHYLTEAKTYGIPTMTTEEMEQYISNH